MSEISCFPASPDLYNSFNTLIICFYGLINKWQLVIFKLGFVFKTGIPKNLCHKISMNMLLSRAYCILRKMCKLHIGFVNAQYMHKILSQCAIYGQDLRMIVLISPMRKIVIYFSNGKCMRKICTRLHFFPQCAIHVQDLCKIVLISPMRNICARFAQDCTSFPNVQYMRKIVLISLIHNLRERLYLISNLKC